MLRNYIMKQTDLEVLRRWHKIAARADSINDFEQAVGLLSMHRNNEQEKKRKLCDSYEVTLSCISRQYVLCRKENPIVVENK